MADSEDIGGISVSVGASHARLQTDLAEANRLLERYASQHFEATVGARFVAPQGQSAAARNSAQRPLSAATTQTSAASTASVKAELSGVLTALREFAAGVRRINVTQSGGVTTTGTLSSHDRRINDDLSVKIGRNISARRGASGGASASDEEEAKQSGLRRKNINARDIGTGADVGRVYSFDPNDESAQGAGPTGGYHAGGSVPFAERQKRAASARQREIALQQHAGRNRRVETKQLDADALRLRAAQDELPNSESIVGSAKYTPGAVTARRGPTNANRPPRQRSQRSQDESIARRRDAFDAAHDPSIEAAFAQSRRVRQFQASEESQARTIRSRTASITGSGRTSRTLASGISALFGGTEGRQIAAQASAQESRRALGTANSAIAPLDNQLKDLAKAWSGATGEERKNNREKFLTIRHNDDYRQALVNQRKAIKDNVVAEAELDKISSKGNIARNLAAITLGGAAFSVGLQAVNIGLQAASKAFDPYIQQATGFIGITQQLTSSLADQGRQQQGNIKGVTLQALANSGLSDATSGTIAPIISQRASIEAGNKAITDQIALIRSAQQLQTQGPNAGLGSTTGGALGTPLFGIPSTGEQIGGLLRESGSAAQGPTSTAQTTTQVHPIKGGAITTTTQATPEQVGATAQATARYAQDLAYVNAQLDKGGDGAAKFNTALSNTDARVEATAKSFDAVSPNMAQAIRFNHLYSDSIKTTADAQKALLAINFAGTLPDLATVGQQALTQEQFRQRASPATIPALQSQQAFVRPAEIAAVDRQQQYSLNTQLPAQAGLQALSNPLQPVGTGIVAANAGEQRKINAGLKEAGALQKDLNSYYEQGKQVLIDTYKVPPALIAQVDQVGKAIASAQAGISNEQAGYQVAQYNFQLMIARRTLSDIGGLTGKNFGAGESYLGSLEKQNLALSRQGQLLQFNLSQRQINFQTAVAGFSAPGVTPQERQANIAEAKVEASYAQKQLDIQKQSFKNQVKIVDIGNLRQGADLAKQIGLILQGRQVTIDTQLAQAKLLRLQATQQKLVGQVGTYISRVDSLTAAAFKDIHDLEAAAGHAIEGIAVQVLAQYGIVIKGITDYANGANRQKAPTSGTLHRKPTATGGIFQTSGATNFGDRVVGEAGGETVAILSHPRAMSGGGGGGGGGTINIIINNPVVREEMDIARITRSVSQALGREGSLKGLRGTG